MSIKDRKTRHKEDLRQAILDAAKRLFLTEGYGATSIRKIANEIEFSPTTIYLYYKDKAEIAHALHTEGFKLLNSQFRVLEYIESPFERLKAMGRAYIQFSIENPDFYELMFVMKEPMEHVKDIGLEDPCWVEGEQAFGGLVNVVAACQQEGYFRNMDTAGMAMLAWSSLHGLCTLNLHGHLDFMKTHKKQLSHIDSIIESTFSSFIKLLEQSR